MADDLITPTGKGWYDVGGRKVRGRTNALAAARNGGARNSDANTFTLDRLDFARRAGLQYSGERDVYKVAGYKKQPTYEDYWSYYDRHPIASRIVDLPAKTTWRRPPEIVEPDQEDGTEFTRAFDELAKRLGLWGRLKRVDRLSRIGQYAVLLIGTRDGLHFDRPLTRLSGPDDVVYLASYSERHARIDTWVTDRGDERHGLPEFYQIDTSRGNSSFRSGAQTSGTERVHWTRLVHVAEDVLDDDVHGQPVLRKVLNTIFNDEKVDAASAEAFWQLADRILQLKADPEATGVDFAAVDQQLQLLYHDLRRTFMMQGGELSWLGGDSPDPTGISEVLATKMAAGAGIPKRILYGSERGELASSQDERQWLGEVRERQETHAEPNVLRPLIDRLVTLGALPRPGDAGYDALWPNLYEPSEQEISERNKSTADTAKALSPVGGDPYELVEVDDAGNVTLRPSEEVWEERERLMGETDDTPGLEPIDGGDEPDTDTEEGEPEEQGEAA
jgi:hypothetical protein